MRKAATQLPTHVFIVLDLTDDTYTFSLVDFEESDHRSKYIFSIVSSQSVCVLQSKRELSNSSSSLIIPIEIRNSKEKKNGFSTEIFAILFFDECKSVSNLVEAKMWRFFYWPLIMLKKIFLFPLKLFGYLNGFLFLAYMIAVIYVFVADKRFQWFEGTSTDAQKTIIE